MKIDCCTVALIVALPLFVWNEPGGEPVAAEGPLEAFATFHAAGLRLPVSGDPNRNARAAVKFRRRGESAWQEALALFRIDSNRFAGSLFNLEPGTEYEVHVRLEHADGAVRQPEPLRFRTTPEAFLARSGRTLYVRAANTGTGTERDPFGSIQQAVDGAGPGDTIVVLPGIYREAVEIKNRRGRADAYISLLGKAGAQIRGTLPEFEAGGGADRWQREEEGVFSAAIPADAGSIGYVAAGEARLYRYGTVDELRRRAAGVRGGYFWSPEERRLYVTLADGTDPNQTTMHVSSRPFGIRLENSDYWILEGLDLGYFGVSGVRGRNYGILIEASANVVVRRNRIHHCNQGLAVQGAASTRVLIEENEIYDTSIIDWPWNQVKATEAEGSGVSLRGGAGQVVRRNRIHGPFNGVAASTWGSLMDESRNNDLDIYENEFYDIGDDPVEPEGTCINLRIWANRMRNCLTVASLAPITVGPTYVLRNASLDHWLTAVKLNVGENNFGWKYVAHNTFVTTRRERRQLDGTMVSDGVSGLALWLHRRAVGAPDRPNPGSFAWANGIFLNNIVYATRHALEAANLRGEVTFDYNNLYSAGSTGLVRLMDVVYPNLLAFQRAGHEPHGISAEPRFVDLARGDLRLRPGSPGIDQAKRLPNINDGFHGPAPDMGAFER